MKKTTTTTATTNPTTRTLKSSPQVLPLYLRAAAPLIPGASFMPFIPGRAKEVPDIQLTLPNVTVNPDRLAAYAKVCGFALGSRLPATYPHMLAFPLHMAVMADGRFPFGAVGLVHIENRIVQYRPLTLGGEGELAITVRPTPLQPHRRGRQFSLITTLTADGELIWEQMSTMLRRGRGSEEAPEAQPLASSGIDPAREPAAAQWKLAGDLGRRYAAVSGDRNPIHLHELTAKPLGFPRAIAHGMWSKARCLAAIQGRLPNAFEIHVRFRAPIMLPSTVRFASAHTQTGQIELAVSAASDGRTHLEGRVQEIDSGGEKR